VCKHITDWTGGKNSGRNTNTSFNLVVVGYVEERTLGPKTYFQNGLR
jgi:hypothetical protein